MEEVLYNTYDGRRKFQIDLAIDIINYGLALDWDGGDERPSYVRKDAFIPCDCKKCLFCKRGVTGLVSGIPPKGKNGKLKRLQLNTPRRDSLWVKVAHIVACATGSLL